MPARICAVAIAAVVLPTPRGPANSATTAGALVPKGADGFASAGSRRRWTI